MKDSQQWKRKSILVFLLGASCTAPGAPSSQPTPDAAAADAQRDSGTAGDGDMPTRHLTFLASGLTLAAGIAVDASFVYVTDELGGAVKKVPIDGGDLITVASGEATPTAIAVDSTSLYWLAGGNVRKIALSGGTPVTLASAFGVDLAIDASNVYWTEHGTVMKVPLGGGTPVRLDPAINGRASTEALAIVGGSAYWYDEGLDAIRTVTVGGGTSTTVSAVPGFGGFGSNGFLNMAVDTHAVYWTYPDGVLEVPLDGGTPATLSSSGSTSIYVDDTSVYWTDGGAGIMKLPLTGGMPTILAPPPGFGLVTDATSLYYTSRGSVIKLTPK